MNFHILTLFPEMIEQGLNTSITGRAISNGLLSIEAVNIRDYAFNKHQSVDDYPYGGGAGMLMQAEPVYLAYEAVRKKIAERKPAEAETETEEPAEAEQLEEKPVTGSEEEPVKEKKLRVVYLSPQGDVFNQKMAEEMNGSFVTCRKGKIYEATLTLPNVFYDDNVGVPTQGLTAILSGGGHHGSV